MTLVVDEPLRQGFAAVLARIYERPQRVVHVVERAGAQGASGARLRYFRVVSVDALGRISADDLVVKPARLLERRILRLLAEQRRAVPPLALPDGEADEPAPVVMPFLEQRPPLDLGHPRSSLTRAIADGLAGIHAANLGRPPAWLRRAADAPLDRLWLRAWRELWQAALADRSFVAELGSYTDALDRAMERFLAALAELSREGDTLTLLNVDLLPDHIRLWQGRPVFIDWEQSSYGPLYLDLPNHFSVETALAYRDALADHGYPIPVAAFLERYRELGRYMGLRYLGAALEQWHAGGDTRVQGRWFLYYMLTLALRGR
jgi:aminoglycoside phosphotransferase (APT) family kinase protein